MLDLGELQSRLVSFSKEYMGDFNYIWKRKIEIEALDDASILDDHHRDETYRRLCSILPKWQTYRPKNNTPCLTTLENSLDKISEAYDQLRKHTLLDFDSIPHKALETVWQELGRAKESRGEMNEYGLYSIISVCKPLLLIWGQTPAFDSNVRKNMPRKYMIDKYAGIWNLKEWKSVLSLLSRELNEDKNAIEFMKKKTAEWYGKNTPVPYGRFLDIYYFKGA